MNTRRFDWILTCVCAAAFLPVSSATTLERLSLKQLTRASTLVVRAECREARTGWGPSGISTIYRFEVEDTWKGSAPVEILVRVPGGHAGHLIRTIPGTPRFRAGEDAVLFLERPSVGTWGITAWSEGTFRIQHGFGRQQMAYEDLNDGASYTPADDPRAPAVPAALRLDRMRKEVRRFAEHQGGRQ